MVEPKKDCERCGSRIGLIGLLTHFFLMVFKVFVGVLSGSIALVASGLYSFQDFISAGVVTIGFKISKKPPDPSHPYGYGKVEFIAVALVSIILIISIVAIFAISLHTIFRGPGEAPHYIALWAAFLSLFVNLGMYRYSSCIAKQLNSPTIISHAAHCKADIFSSCAVVVAVTGAHLGLHAMDWIIAIVEIVHIIGISGKLFGKAIKGLMDTAASEDKVEEIKKVISDIDAVVGVNHIRTRQVGQKIAVDVSLGVPSDMKVEGADKVGNEVRKMLARKVKHTGEILVHYEPSLS